MCYEYHIDLIWSATFDERRANDSNVCWTKPGCIEFLDAVVHFAPAVVKRMKKVGLTDAYANEESTQVVVLCFLALPLLPVLTELAFQNARATVGADTHKSIH